MTDTHWNKRGAYLAYAGFAKLVGVPAPEVSFTQGDPYRGDLIMISNQPDFPLHVQDNWNLIWHTPPTWIETQIDGLQNEAVSKPVIVNNPNALSDKYVWLLGDSFSVALSPYFYATFQEVFFKGHWVDQLPNLPEELRKAERKPDLIVIVRVERSF